MGEGQEREKGLTAAAAAGMGVSRDALKDCYKVARAQAFISDGK